MKELTVSGIITIKSTNKKIIIWLYSLIKDILDVKQEHVIQEYNEQDGKWSLYVEKYSYKINFNQDLNSKAEELIRKIVSFSEDINNENHSEFKRLIAEYTKLSIVNLENDERINLVFNENNRFDYYDGSELKNFIEK